MKRIFSFVFLFLCTWTFCLADTLSGDGFRAEYTTPDGWLSSAEYRTSELEAKLGLAEGTLKALSETSGTTKLYYAVDGAYSLDNAIRITVSPMESYHKNYSSLDETQLGNIANSFMRDGKMDAYQVVKTTGGLAFLQLHHTGGAYAYTFTTNENGAIFRADVPASADMEQVRQWLEGVSIREHQNVLLDLISQYWHYAVISAVVMIGMILKNKHKKAGPSPDQPEETK